MKKILFVCLGNICRSTMAEFVFKDIVKKNGMDSEFVIESAGTSDEAVGDPVHYGTRRKLASVGIDCSGKFARQMMREDYDKFDFIIGMEDRNVRNILRIVGDDREKKVFRLLDLSENPRDIADPWYTGNFDVTYEDVLEGCNLLFKKLK